jgi:hypothetical protein
MLLQRKDNQIGLTAFNSDDKNKPMSCSAQELAVMVTKLKAETDMDCSENDSSPIRIETEKIQSFDPIRIEEQSANQLIAHAQTALHLPDLRSKVRRLEPKEREYSV